MALQPILPGLSLAYPAFQLRLPALLRIPAPLFRISALAIPLIDRLPKPSSFLQDIWEGILRAVPKKKTSKSRTRSRQMAGKALKDVSSVVKCPSCGRPKRSHYLCPHCVYGMLSLPQDSEDKLTQIAIQLYWKQAWRRLRGSEEDTNITRLDNAARTNQVTRAEQKRT